MADNQLYIRIIRNFLYHMPRAYRNRTPNYRVVMDILTAGTSHGGMTSAIAFCHDIGIAPDGHILPDTVYRSCDTCAKQRTMECPNSAECQAKTMLPHWVEKQAQKGRED